MEAKLTKRARKKSSTLKEHCTRAFERVAIDFAGPVSPMTDKEYTHYLVVIDIYSNGVWVYPVQRRSDAPVVFRRFLEDIVMKQNVSTVLALRSDRAPELYDISAEMRAIFNEFGIRDRSTTAPESSGTQNSACERMVRTVIVVARSLISGCPKSELANALLHAA